MAAVTAFPSASDSPRSSGRSADFSNAVTSSVRLAAPSSAVIWSRILTCMAHLPFSSLANEFPTTAGVESPSGSNIRPARLRCPSWPSTTIGLHSGHNQANWDMASVKRAAAAAVAAILVREGVDYAQSKAVFKAARQKAGLHAPPEHRGGVDRLTVEEELRFLDQAYAQDGRTGLMLQTLLEMHVGVVRRSNPQQRGWKTLGRCPPADPQAVRSGCARSAVCVILGGYEAEGLHPHVP